MGKNGEIKVTLQELLSLYTGGRPIGTRDFIEQYEDFFTNYGQLMYIDILKYTGKKMIKIEEKNFENMIAAIDKQYPELKKSEKFCALYNEYKEKVPALYSDEAKDVMINGLEYQWLGKRLVKEARNILGSQKTFVVKNIKAIRK